MIGIFLIGVIITYTTIKLWKDNRSAGIIKATILVISSFMCGFILQEIGFRNMAVYFSMVLATFCAICFLHIGTKRFSSWFLIMYIVFEGVLSAMVIYEKRVLVFAEVLLALLFFLAENNLRYLKRSYEMSAMEYQNRILDRQVEEVQNIYLTMRGWRHDYHNHLQTLKAHLKMGNISLAEEYLEKLEVDLDQVSEMIQSGNVRLDAILNSKLSLALNQEIEVNYKAKVPEHLTVTDLDLCVVIGNLIDNAVESCEKVTEGRRFLRLYIGVLRNQLYISVTNSTMELVRKMDEEYITTKRGNHGHGLKRINLIVDKYDGYINRKNEPGVFVTEIMLPL